MRQVIPPLSVVVLVLAACGGGGGSGSRQPTQTPNPRATRTATAFPTPSNSPRPTRTPGPPVTLFVRQNGDDDNTGTRPERALRTLGVALKRLTPGSTLHVGPGVYLERLAVGNLIGTAARPVQILADRSGTATRDLPGDVIVDADGDLVAGIITNSRYVTIDGFQFRGTIPTDSTAAVDLRVRGGSDHIAIRNCFIDGGSDSDGVRIDSSSNVLLFNTAVFSSDRGITITGAANGVALINDTVVLSRRAGLSLRTSGGVAPVDVTAVNCIFQENGGGAAIEAANAPDGYRGDYNIVYQPGAEGPEEAYNPPELRGEHDIPADPRFVDVNGGDLHLRSSGPASPAIDTGTDAIDPELVEQLLLGSTTTDGLADITPVDRGFHFPATAPTMASR